MRIYLSCSSGCRILRICGAGSGIAMQGFAALLNEGLDVAKNEKVARMTFDHGRWPGVSSLVGEWSPMLNSS